VPAANGQVISKLKFCIQLRFGPVLGAEVPHMFYLASISIALCVGATLGFGGWFRA